MANTYIRYNSIIDGYGMMGYTGTKEGWPVELRTLHYFLTVAREQSISAAAESLHISQPALSTQLKGMEAELGKQLLIRGTKGSRKVVLTEEGMILRRRAEEILSLVQKAEEEITRSDETIVGDVVIGAGETDSVRLLAQAARELQKQYPDIHYHISSGNAEYVLEYLDKGLIDFGLLFREPDPKKYEWLALPAGDIWGVLMRRDAPLARKVAVCPEDLWDLPLITSHQKGDDHRLAQWMGREISELNVVATYNLVFNASLLVDEGLGYALCFRDLSRAMYGIVALYILSLLIDRVVYGPNAAKVAYIISEQYEAITRELLQLDRGVTLLEGKGAWSGKDKRVILCAFGRRQIIPVKKLVQAVDPNAFVIVCDAHEILGEGFGTYDPTGL